MQPVFEKTLPEHHRRSVHTHRHTHVGLFTDTHTQHTHTHTHSGCVSLTIDLKGFFFLFQNHLKLDFSDFKQVCDIIVNNLFMRGVTQISIIMTTTANHTLYGITFARADLIPL